MSAELRVLVGPAGAAGLAAYTAGRRREQVLRLGGVQGLVAGEDCACTATPAALAWLYWTVAERLAAGELVVVDATGAAAADRVALLAAAREATRVADTTAVLATAGVLGRVTLADGGVLEATVATGPGGAELAVVHRYPAGEREQLCSLETPPTGGADRVAAQRLAEAAAWLAGGQDSDPGPVEAPSVRQLMVEGWRRVLDVDPAGRVAATYAHGGHCPQCTADNPRRTCRTPAPIGGAR
jgi:hypothetical protein